MRPFDIGSSTLKTYAIGDVHGRADLLAAMLSHLEQENEDDLLDYRVVFLGDIIDRGPDSAKAMDLVLEELERRAQSRLILGNHEEFLLLFLDRPDKRHIVFDHWMTNGGLAAAASYGLDVNRRYPNIADAHAELLSLLEARPAHIAVLRNARSHVLATDHVFVHAGLRPKVAIGDQTPKDMRTIRAAFLESDYDFGLTVVHGHTVTKSGLPEVYGNRIALDTGAETSGVLSTLVVEPGRRNRFLATRATAGSVCVGSIDSKVITGFPNIETTTARDQSRALRLRRLG